MHGFSNYQEVCYFTKDHSAHCKRREEHFREVRIKEKARTNLDDHRRSSRRPTLRLRFA